MACVYIPVQNSSEEVRVALNELPRDATDILDILKAEQAPLNLWLTFAIEYFKQGKVNEFLQILEEGSSPEIDEYYSDVKYDRIAILNALGAYYTNLGKVEVKQREKDEFFIRATHYYNKASRIDQTEPFTWIGKGQLCLAKGDLDQSFESFKIVLDGQPDNVPAMLGQACVQFNRGKFQEALNIYKKALQIHPQCPASVRLGMGLCRLRLGQLMKARQAFERVLQLDPENVEALVALGTLDIGSNDRDNVREGMEKMRAAYEIYPYCPLALNHLANHYFYTGQHYVVGQLMESAIASTDHALIKSQSYYNIARTYHAKGDFEKAAAYYRASTQDLKNPRDFILPYYGLGQVHLRLGDVKTALANFEKVLDVHPENCDTLKAIGHIYVHQNRTDKALESFRKATKHNPRDVDAWVEIGYLLVASDIGQALEALTQAQSLLKKQQEVIPLALLNNIGVLHLERGEYEAALQSFREALDEGIWQEISSGNLTPTRGDISFVEGGDNEEFFLSFETEGAPLDVPSEKVTVLFNLARVHELLHESSKATVLYEMIIFKHPNYVDAYLRLAAMALSRNRISLSTELVSKALDKNERHAEALTFRASLELKVDDWLKAKETIKEVLQLSDGKDSYATLALGNWNYYAAVRGERKDPKLEATHLEKSKELYGKVLSVKHNNMYAANGLGVVSAEKGLFDTAKEIFTQVQESAAGNITVEMPDVWINLAHVFLAQGQFALAVKMYQNCLKRFYYNTETNVLLYLARTHYEAEQWQECKRVLLRSIHLQPSNYTLRFDAAIAMQKYSTATLQKVKRTADEVRQSVAELKNALRLFSQLSGITSHHLHGFDEKKIDMHVEYCKHLLEAAKVHLEAAEREEQQTRQKQEVARQQAVAEDARRKAEDERKLQIERRKRDLELRKVQEEEAKLSRLKDSWREKERDRRREKPAVEDDEFIVEKKEKRKEKRRRKRDKRQREENEERVEDDPEDEADGLPEQDLAAAGLDESDDEDGMVQEDRHPRKRGRRQALSESEDEEMPERGGGDDFTAPSRKRYVESDNEGDDDRATKDPSNDLSNGHSKRHAESESE